MERQQWLATRRTGIGGSDAAAILGLSPWRSQMDVWLDKRGLAEERRDPDADFLLDLGLLMEPVLTDLYRRETHRETHPGTLVRHKDAPILLGTPDRICNDELRGVELKTENQFTDNFGEPNTDQIPDHYLIQVAHYMAITELPVWDVAVLHGGTRFAVYTVERDLELETQMVERLLAWWQQHIVRGVPPDVDNSNAWRVYLHKKYPHELLPMVALPEEENRTIERLGQVRQAEHILESLRTELENKLKSVIGDHEGVFSPHGKITWKKTKDSKHTDFEGAYYAVRKHAYEVLQKRFPDAAEKFLDLAEKCLEISTTTKPGVRRFLFTAPKGAKDAGNNVIDISTATGSYRIAPTSGGDSEHSASGPSESGDRSPLRDGGETPA